MAESKVSFVVVSFLHPEETLRTIRDLAFARRAPDRIVIIDNANSEGLERTIGELKAEGITYLGMKKNLGFAGGANAGIRYLLDPFPPDWIVILNEDLTITPELRMRLELVKADPKIGIYAPAFQDAGGDSTVIVGKYIDFKVGLPRDLPPRRGGVHEVDCVDGRCIALRRSMLDEIGLFDERYFAFLEDTELCYRARKNGYKVVCDSNVTVTNRAGPGTPSVVQNYLVHRNRILFLSAYSSAPYLLMSTVAWFLAILPASWLRAQVSSSKTAKEKASARLDGNVDGLRICLGLPPAMSARYIDSQLAGGHP